MATEQFSERKTLMIVAPFKGDAISLGKLLGDIYPVQAHHDLASDRKSVV